MKNLTLDNIARVCGGTYYGPADKLQEEVMSVITDSRKAEEGGGHPGLGQEKCGDR